MQPTPAVRDSLREQLAHHYRSMPFMVLATCLGALYCVWALWDALPQRHLVIGYSLVLALSALRFAQMLAFNRNAHDRWRVTPWYLGAIIGATASGLLWGSASVFLLPVVDAQYKQFLTIMLALVPMIAIGTSAVCLPVFYAYYLPALLPLAALLAAPLSRSGVVSAGLLLIMGGAIAAFAHRYSHSWNNAVRLGAELEQSLREKSRIIAYANHDLRQPAGALLLYVSSLGELLARLERPDVYRKLLVQAQLIDELLGSVWNTTDLDDPTVNPSLSAFSLRALAEDLCDAFSIMAEERGLAVINDVPEVSVTSAHALMLRLVSNLVLNGLTHTQQGQVRMHAAIDGQYVDLIVSDAGDGIPAELHDVVFDEYVQLDVSARRGQGLGLAISRMIARRLDHPLSINNNEHGGADFRLRIPKSTSGARVTGQLAS